MKRTAFGMAAMMGVIALCIFAPEWVDRNAWTGSLTTAFFFIGLWLIAGRKDAQ